MAEGRTPTLLLGGTFDPVHEGHLALARTAADAFGAVVRLLPSAVPPHRATPHATAEQRAAMLRLATAGDPRLAVDTRELARAGSSYTVDTLEALRLELGPGAPIGLLLGADAFLGLSAWHRWQRIPELAHLVVVTRPGSRLDALPDALDRALRAHWTGHRDRLREQPAGLVHQLEMEPHPASATAIRRALATGTPGVPGLPPSVLAYIAEQGLYGTSDRRHR
jgi:nicotinate-nucleotide adenylyltransferase